MNILIYDSQIDILWKEERFIDLIDLLKKRYDEKKQVAELVTLIAYCWYIALEGDCVKMNGLTNSGLTDEETRAAFEGFKKYFDIGLVYHVEEPEFMFIGGYIASGDGGFLTGDENYIEKGMHLMRKCAVSNDERLSPMAKVHIANTAPNASELIYSENQEQIKNELFPTKSELDEYFVGVFTN